MFQLSSSESLNDSSMHELLGMCGIKELVMEMQEPFPAGQWCRCGAPPLGHGGLVRGQEWCRCGGPPLGHGALVRGPQVGRQASQEHGIGYGEAACGSLEIFYIYFDWIFEK
jgi:hypothetical protein